MKLLLDLRAMPQAGEDLAIKLTLAAFSSPTGPPTSEVSSFTWVKAASSSFARAGKRLCLHLVIYYGRAVTTYLLRFPMN